MENQKYFKTGDINLAAYLMSGGAEYYNAKIEEGKFDLYFAKDEKTLKLFNNFKRDSWLRNYNESRKFCLNTMREVKRQIAE